jgi:hypothetical protein
VEEETSTLVAPLIPRIRTPRLAHREDAADFVMDVRETGEVRGSV